MWVTVGSLSAGVSIVFQGAKSLSNCVNNYWECA